MYGGMYKEVQLNAIKILLLVCMPGKFFNLTATTVY